MTARRDDGAGLAAAALTLGFMGAVGVVGMLRRTGVDRSRWWPATRSRRSEPPLPRLSGLRRRTRWGLGAAIAVAIPAMAHSIRAPAEASAGLVTGIGFAWLSVRLGLAHTHRPHRGEPPPGLRVVVVVPVHNEVPALLERCLRSIEHQSRRPDAVWVIDDGSATPAARDEARRWGERMAGAITVEVRAIRHAGKRHAQAVAFTAEPSADVFVTVDSDTVLDTNAIAEGLRPFADERVQSVAGLILGSNHRESLVARVVDLGVAGAGLVGRAAGAQFGAVTVNSGALALYRGDMVRDNLHDYLNETFLGRPVQSGDDRRLTSYALLAGRTVLQESAIGYTEFPARLGALIRQRNRWYKNFYRGSIYLLMRLPLRSPAYWITAWKLASLLVFTVFIALVAITWVGGGFPLAPAFLLYLLGLSYVRAARYLVIRRAESSLPRQVATFGLAPLHTLLHLLVLLPLQYWSLLTLTSTAWGTRQASAPTPRPAPAPV